MTEFIFTDEMKNEIRNINLTNKVFAKKQIDDFENSITYNDLIYSNAVFYLSRTKTKPEKNIFENALKFIADKYETRDGLKYLYLDKNGFMYASNGKVLFRTNISNHSVYQEIKDMIEWENEYIYMKPINKSFFPSNISNNKELNEYYKKIQNTPEEHPLYGTVKFADMFINAEKVISIGNKFYAIINHELNCPTLNFNIVIDGFSESNGNNNKKATIKLNDECIETLASICKLNNIVEEKDYISCIPIFTREQIFINCNLLFNTLKCFDIFKNIEIKYSDYTAPILFQQDNIFVYTMPLNGKRNPEKIKGFFDFFACYPEDEEQNQEEPKQNKNSKQKETKKIKQTQEETMQKPEPILNDDSEQNNIQASEQATNQEEAIQEEPPVAIKETNSQETQENNQEMEENEMNESTKQNFKFELNDVSKRLLSFKQSMSYYGIKTYEPRIDFINRYYKKGICTTGTIVDKNGKSHFVVNGNFLGEECFKYALYLLTGGEIIEKI